MTKRHLQSDKEREVNGQTAILAKRLAAAERDEALDALRMRVIDAQFWAKQCEILVQERNEARAQLAEAKQELARSQLYGKDMRAYLTAAESQLAEVQHTLSVERAAFREALAEHEAQLEGFRAQLAEARLSPWLLAETLEDTTAQHDPLPAPPIAEIATLRAQLAEAQEYIDTVPPFAAAAGQRMADEINRLVLARVIDSRSPAADASLDWKDPDRTRIDEIDDLRAQLAEKNRDSERLDWIGINAEVIPSRSTHGLEERNCQRLRAAIDAAMHDDSAEPGLRPEDEYDAG